MNNVINEFNSFIIDRYEKSYHERLGQDKEYLELQDQFNKALHELLGDDPQNKQKYSKMDQIEGQIESMRLITAYIQGMKDAAEFKELIG